MNEAEALLELLADDVVVPHPASLAVSLSSALSNAPPRPSTPQKLLTANSTSTTQRGCFALPTSNEAQLEVEAARNEQLRAQRIVVEPKTSIRISRPTAAFDQVHLVQTQYAHLPLPQLVLPQNHPRSHDHSSIGVVVAKYDPKLSSGKGGQYSTVKVWDLQGFSSQSAVRLLMTSAAFREHYKSIDVGSVVCIVRPAVLPPKDGSGTSDAMLHVGELDQIKRLGHATDFGYCRATTESSGQPCRNPVNVATPYCLSHLSALRSSVKQPRGPPTPLSGGKAMPTPFRGGAPSPLTTAAAAAAAAAATTRPPNDLLCIKSRRVISQQLPSTTKPQHLSALDLTFGGGPPMSTGVDRSATVPSTLGTIGRGKLVLDAALRQAERKQTDAIIRDATKRPRDTSSTDLHPPAAPARLLSYSPLVGHADPLLSNVVLSRPQAAGRNNGVVADTIRRSNSTSNVVQLAESLGSRNGGLREADERSKLDRSGQHLAEADRVLAALSTVHEKKVRAVHCLQCNRWHFHRPQTCVAAGHTLHSGEVMQRYVACEHCHEKATILGDINPALILPRCPRCKQLASWTKSSAAPVSLKSLLQLKGETENSV
jgi:hypothetical protein